jgi:hypothetical protein
MNKMKLLFIVAIVAALTACEEYETFKSDIQVSNTDTVFIEKQALNTDCDLDFDYEIYKDYSLDSFVCFVVNDTMIDELTEMHFMYYMDIIEYCDLNLNIRKCDE